MFPDAHPDGKTKDLLKSLEEFADDEKNRNLRELFVRRVRFVRMRRNPLCS